MKWTPGLFALPPFIYAAITCSNFTTTYMYMLPQLPWLTCTPAHWLRADHARILIDGAVVAQVESFKFLGVHINKLEWSKHTKTVVKRARQNLLPLRRLKRFGMGPQILKRFYRCTITAWYGKCSASDRKALQRVVCTAEYITGAKLSAIHCYYLLLFYCCSIYLLLLFIFLKTALLVNKGL